MPWTFAHPAAVLPLRGLCPRWLSLPGLVIGSLTPDLGYYGGQLGLASFSHTLPGVIVCCLPLGLLLLALLVRFAKPLTVLLPAPHRQLVRGQLAGAPRPAWAAIAVAASSILLGALSHVLWDSFTHAGRWGVTSLPWLSLHLFDAGARPIRVFNVLQHLSTAAGLIAMAVVYRSAVRAQPVAPSPSAALDAMRTRLLLAGVVCSVVFGAAVALSPAAPASVSLRVVRTVVWSTSSFAALFLGASLVWWRRRGDV